MYSIEYEANILCECWFKQVHRSSRVPDLSFRNSDILLSVLSTFTYMYPRLIWTYWSFFSRLHCTWCFSPLSSSHSHVAVLVWYMLMIRFHYRIFVKKKNKKSKSPLCLARLGLRFVTCVKTVGLDVHLPTKHNSVARLSHNSVPLQAVWHNCILKYTLLLQYWIHWQFLSH